MLDNVNASIAMISCEEYTVRMSTQSTAEDKRAHLAMIQGVINRMGGNLFYLRGWSIAIIAGVLAILSQKAHPDALPLYFLGAITMLFWVYDGYFLAQERQFRALYDDVRIKKPEDIDYSMDTKKFVKYVDNKVVWCMFSKTIWPFYISLLSATVYIIATAG